MTKIFKSLLLGLLLMGFASPVFAHSDILETNPADGAVLYEMPENFVVTYNENLIADGTFAVLVSDGQPTPLTTEVIDNQVFIRMDSDLPPGEYVVEFKTVAADGHPQEGSINFTLFMQAVAVPAEIEPAVVPEVTIMQPVQESSSNLNALWGALAVILAASLLLARLRTKKNN
jgi:methionine-rich copper-binding protein CopC